MMLCCNKKSWIYNEVFPLSNIFTAIKTYFFQLMHLAEKISVLLITYIFLRNISYT